MWENGTELFRREKGQATKKIKDIKRENKDAKMKSFKLHDSPLY